jgi:hypothetical protein
MQIEWGRVVILVLVLHLPMVPFCTKVIKSDAGVAIAHKTRDPLSCYCGNPPRPQAGIQTCLLTPLKALSWPNKMRVTTLCLYHARSIALESTSKACSVVLPGRPPNWLFSSRPCFPARYESRRAITASRGFSCVIRSVIGR